MTDPRFEWRGDRVHRCGRHRQGLDAKHRLLGRSSAVGICRSVAMRIRAFNTVRIDRARAVGSNDDARNENRFDLDRG